MRLFMRFALLFMTFCLTFSCRAQETCTDSWLTAKIANATVELTKLNETYHELLAEQTCPGCSYVGPYIFMLGLVYGSHVLSHFWGVYQAARVRHGGEAQGPGWVEAFCLGFIKALTTTATTGATAATTALETQIRTAEQHH